MTEEISVEGATEGYLELLRRYNVEYVFCSPGTEFVPFWEFLGKFNAQGKKPGYINARHESLALAMAKGYTMATRTPQVVLLHVNVGVLHGAMEIKTLHLDNIPMLIIAGQNKTHDREVFGGSGGSQFLAFTEVGGTQRLIQPYVKWCDAPDTNINMPHILARAFRVATSEPKGPVFLLLSRELMFEKIQKMKIPYNINPSSSLQADPAALKTLADLFAEADNPLIYTRYLGRNPTAVEALVQFADLTSTPVIETPVYMNFPTDHPLHLGYTISPYIKDADLIVVIDGSGRPPWYPPSSVLTRTTAKIVFLDLDPFQLNYHYWGYPADLLITADSSLALPALLDTLKQTLVRHQTLSNKIEERRQKWTTEHHKQRTELRETAVAAEDNMPIDPKWLCYNLNEVMDDNTIVVTETITHRRVINQYVEKHRIKPGTQFDGAGTHTSMLGQGLGVALGLKLAHPETTVIALEGDGSFNYNPVHACFGLSQVYRLPFLTILFDNQSYAAMKHHARYYPEGWSVKTDTYYGVYETPKPDYTKLAHAFDGYAETVEDPAEVNSALRRALKQVQGGRLALLDVLLPRP